VDNSSTYAGAVAPNSWSDLDVNGKYIDLINAI